FAGTISRALDLLLDIITHFQRDAVLVHSRPFRKQKEGENADDNWKSPHEGEASRSGTSHWRRKQIADRFQCLVNYMVRQQGVSDLTIMAHSQGTVTAIEQLQTIDGWLELQPFPTSLRIQLITIGSPYYHVYQHYFSGDFHEPTLTRVNKWINIYTTNDYVGTEIVTKDVKKPVNINREKPFDIKYATENDKLTKSAEQQIIDQAKKQKLDVAKLTDWCRRGVDAKAIGHNGYWTDELVMDFIQELAPFEG
ncbi:MAG: hypothetical protein OEU92_13935, partial [Alphaproteobacteria bacterium]|nr:hypothetical protein [Alphaproteobacteria bacterium]